MTPKLFIHSADISGNSDGTVTKQLLDFLPNRISRIVEADAVIVSVSYMNDFKFDRRLYDVPREKIIILDHLEFGWNWGDKENRLGYGALAGCGHLSTPEYAALDQWVKNCPPRLTFKRELFKRDVTEAMLPVEFLCTNEPKTPHSPTQYAERPFEVFNVWGLSHPTRQRFHGDVFRHAHDAGISILSDWSMEQHLEKRNWVTIFSPHYMRRPIQEVLRWQRRAKISMSLFGAGRKSFRDSESCIDCLMARPEDGLAWSFPWTDENSIVLRQDFEFLDVESATRFPDLHQRYLAGLDNVDKYRSRRYVNEYIMPALQRFL